MTNATLIYLNHYNLQKHDLIRIGFMNEDTTAAVDLQTIDLARSDGSAAVNIRNLNKVITLQGYVNEGVDTSDDTTAGLTVQEYKEVQKTISAAILQDIRYKNYLRVVPEYVNWDITEATTGWAATADMDGLGTSSVHRQVGSLALRTNYDPTNSVNDYGVLEYTGSTAVDLTASPISGYGEVNFNFSMYIPTPYNITSVDIRVGTDSSNYYAATSLTPFRGPLKQGWNHFSVPVTNLQAFETGTVTDSNIKYFRVQVTHDASADVTDYLYLDGLMFVNEDLVRNYPGFMQGAFEFEGNSWNNNFSRTILNFNNLTGYAESTNQYEVYSEDGITATSAIFPFKCEGSTVQKPTTTLTVNTATDVSAMKLVNLDNNQETIIDVSNIANATTYQVGRDVSGVITENGLQGDATGYAPTAIPGWNKYNLVVTPTAAATVTSGGAVNTALTKATTIPTGGDPVNIAYLAQSFVAPGSNIDEVELYGRMSGGLFTSLKVYLAPDSAGSPNFGSKTLIGTFSNKTNQTLSFTGLGYTTTTSATYWIIVETNIEYNRSGSVSDGYTFTGYIYNTTGSYGSGSIKSSTNDGSSWSAEAGFGDFFFTGVQGVAPAHDIDVAINQYRLYAS